MTVSESANQNNPFALFVQNSRSIFQLDRRAGLSAIAELLVMHVSTELHQKISTHDARESVFRGEDYATIPPPDSSSYQQLEMTPSNPTPTYL